MSDKLRMIGGVEPIKPPTQATSAPTAKGQSFGDFLAEQLKEVNDKGLEADRGIQRSLLGEEANPHRTMIAIQKADVSLRLMMAIKDRVEQAYQQLIRTQI